MDRRVDDEKYFEDIKHGDEDLEEVKQLANMLKMMDQPETLLFELLEILCESTGFESDEVFISIGEEAEIIKLDCERHEEGHYLYKWAFEILEMAENKLGTSLQTVDCLAFLTEDGQPVSPANQFNEEESNLLLQRIIRQKKALSVMKMSSVVLSGTVDDRAFVHLLKYTTRWVICRIVLSDDFGKEDWSSLAEAMKFMKKSEDLRVALVEMPREVLLRGSNEDLQTVWESVKFGNHDPSGTCSCGFQTGWLLDKGSFREVFFSTTIFVKNFGLKAKELIEE